MTIFQIECFYSLSLTLNYTQTASQQFITQPALSRSIIAIEAELDTKLINRSTHKVSLTASGEIFALHCKKIIDTYRAGVHQAKIATENFTGIVRLGVPIDSFEPLAVNLAQLIAEKAPGIHLELKFNSPTALITSLDSDSVDMVIASGKSKSDDTKAILIDKRVTYAVLPKSHPLANKEIISFSDLKHEDFIAMSRLSSVAGYESIINYGIQAEFSPNITFEALSVSSLLMQVACGLGVSVLYKDHSKLSGEHVAFVPLENPQIFNRYFIYKTNNPCADAIAKLVEELFEVK